MKPGFNAPSATSEYRHKQAGARAEQLDARCRSVVCLGFVPAQLGRYRLIRRACGGRELAFFVESTRDDGIHALAPQLETVGGNRVAWPKHRLSGATAHSTRRPDAL